jgi:hypothetical protein
MRNPASTATGQPQPPDPTRRLVIEGDKAWGVSGAVRHRWLADKLFPRKTAPKEAMPFIAAQVLTRPGPLRDNLGHATSSPVFTELTSGTYKPAEVAAWPAGRLPLALLAAVAACYEEKLTSPTGKMTWRTDRPTEYSSCSRKRTRAAAPSRRRTTASTRLRPALTFRPRARAWPPRSPMAWRPVSPRN